MTRPVSAWANLLAIASMMALLLPVGLVAAPVVLAADPEVVSTVDFDDGTTGTWTQSGSPTLSFVPDGAGGQALSILRARTSRASSRRPACSSTTSCTRSRCRPGCPRARPARPTSGSWSSLHVGRQHHDRRLRLDDDQRHLHPARRVDPRPARSTSAAPTRPGRTLLVDDILITAPSAPPPTVTVLSTDFEDGLDGWVPRGDAQGDPTVNLTTDESHSPTHAALVSDRTSQGDGIGHDVTGVMNPGTTYVITAWVKFAAGNPTDTLWLSMRRTNGGSDAFDTVGQFTAVSGATFVEVSATYAMGDADSAFLYFEPLAGRDDRPVPRRRHHRGVAGAAGRRGPDAGQGHGRLPARRGDRLRETTGASSELLLRHFDQVTPENHMKPEAWYDENRTFRIHPEAEAIMDFAQDNGTRVYGHTLVWHSQTPAWFFQHDDGTPLTTSDADRALLRTQLHDHIFDVAETLSSMYGLFGSSTNPLVAFDVVNEVVSDGTTEADGLRRSLVQRPGRGLHRRRLRLR